MNTRFDLKNTFLILAFLLVFAPVQAWTDPVTRSCSASTYAGILDPSLTSHRDDYDADYYGTSGWLGNGATGAWLKYDFGTSVELQNVVLWNWAGDWDAATNRGVQDFTLSFSTDDVTYTTPISFNALEAVSSDAEPSQVFTFTPVTARYAKLTCVSNHGDVTYTGIGQLLYNDPTLLSSGALVHHWNFDEGPDWHNDPFQRVYTIRTVEDFVSGADADLVNMDSSAWVSGKQFGALELDGTNDYLSVSTDLSVTLGDASSLAYWIRTTAGANAGITGSTDIKWGQINASGQVVLTVDGSVAVTSAMQVNDGDWHHVVITRNATTGDAQIYIDGTLSASGTGCTGVKTTAFYDIGRIGTAYFEGRLDQVYVYNEVIDADTITTIMNNHAPQTWDVTTDVVNTQTCATASVLFNTYDPEADTLSVTGYSNPSNGTLADNGDGTFDYMANPGFVGRDHFYVYITDGSGGYASTNVYVDVLAPQDPLDGQKRTTNFTDFQALQAGGSDISLAGLRVPRAVDWDNDGDNDLLVGYAGSVWRYTNIGNPNSPSFNSAVKVQANGLDISLSGNVAIALADLTDDGVEDLIAVDNSRKVRVYENTSAAGHIPVYASAAIIQSSSSGGDFVSPDIRFDLGDWDDDGKLDLFTGTFSGSMYVYLNEGSTSVAQYNPNEKILLMSDSYNLYPRYFDLTRNTIPDLIRGINWGTIGYWFDSSLHSGLGTNGSLMITDASGVSANINATTDGAIVDFADFNGDDVYDILIGGHGFDKVYIAYGIEKTVADYIADIEAIYDANPTELGIALEANGQELLYKVRVAEAGIITHIQASTYDVRQTIFDQMVGHVQKYSFLQMDHSLDVTYFHHVPSISGQNLMTMHHTLPDTPAHRANVADAVNLTGLHREIYLKTGLHVGDNQEASQGQLESIRDFMTYHPRKAFPDMVLTLDAYFDWGGSGWVNVFTSGKNTFGSETGWDTTEYASDLRGPIVNVFGDNACNGDYFTLVMGHEVCHSLDGYVTSRENTDLCRRWGQMLTYCAGPDVIAGSNGWIDWSATKAHFQNEGYWDGVEANWQTDWDAYWNSGPGSAWNNLTFTRGGIGTFFLTSPQESLATQANLHWPHSEGRLVGAIDRYRRYKGSIGHMISVVNEVVTFFDFVSAGLNKVVMYDTRGSSTPYPRATYYISYAYLERNDKGYITKITVDDRIYEFTLADDGRVTGVSTNMLIAEDDSAVADSDTDVVIGVLANDATLEGGTGLTVSGVDQPAHGTVVNNGDGTVTYHSNPGYSGGDAFTYTVTNGLGVATATVTVSVIDEYKTTHRWKLDDGSGTTAADFVSGADGTVNGATWTTGKVGGALGLDGGDSVTFGTGPSLSGQVDFSVAAWIQTSASTSQNVIQQTVGDYNGEYLLSINSNGTVRFMIYGDYAYQFDFSTYVTVNDGQWHYVMAVRDGRYGFIYIDGVLKGADQGDIRNLAAHIGVSVGDAFNGYIDDVRICIKALSSQEVVDLYESMIQEGKMFNLLTLVSSWLDVDCGLCGGADYSDDGKVDMADFALLTKDWLAPD